MASKANRLTALGSRSLRRPLRYEVVALGALVVVGGVLRAAGFTSKDLWFDDAWSASAARASFGQSLHMMLTAPGYAFVQRLWLMIDPTTTWWAQLPAFLLGLAAIVTIWALVRWLGYSSRAALLAATFMAVTPTAVSYATRVKEYGADLLAAVVLLALVEQFRREPRARGLLALAVTSVLALLISASCAVVVVGAWLTVALLVVRQRPLWAKFARGAAVTAVGVGAVYLLFLRTIPSALQVNWRRRGYLLDYRSSFLLKRSLRMVFGGFAHTTLGVAVPANFYRGGTHSVALDYLAIVVGVVVIGACILVPLWLAWRDRRVTVAVSASLTLAVAVLLAVVDYVPLGDGRTDEVLYPALVVAGATVLTALCRWLASLVTNPRPVVATVLCGVVAAGGIVFGAVHPGAYPTLDLRGLARQVQAQQEIHPKQVVVVDTFNSFAWCYYKLSPCRLQIGGHPEWPQGFQPISTSRSTYIPKEYFGPFNDAATALRGVNEVWYVGYDYGTYDVGSPEFAHVPAHPGLLKKLLSLGFTDATGPHSLLTADDVYAQLLVRRAA